MFMKKMCILVAVPLALAFFFKQGYSAHDIPHAMSAVVPFLGEFAWFAALIGIAFIIFEHQIKDTVLPGLATIFKDDVIQNMKDSGVIFGVRLNEEKVPFSSPELISILEHNKSQFIHQMRDIQKPIGNSNEQSALDAILINKDPEEAIQILDNLSKKNPDYNYNSQLLTVLVASENSDNWKRAEALLPVAGRPLHYLHLAYSYWVTGYPDKAIAILETGYEIAKKDDSTKNNKKAMAAMKNSLAYYYADAQHKTKAQLAKELAEESVTATKELEGESESFGKRLSTLGYVKITFGETKEDIREGINDCTKAWRLGADEELFFRHINRAKERLSVL